ncbi:MAG: DUF2927 domain-containing protein [Hyphomicrobiales bacterium]
MDIFYNTPQENRVFNTLCAVLILIFSPVILTNAQADNITIDQKVIKRDFMRVVMSAEYGGNSKFGRSVKKYDSTVRFAIINHSKLDRRQAIKGFVWSLPTKIAGLKTSVVSNPQQANFRIHVVDKDQYADVIRNEIYGGARKPVRGKCFVRVLASKNANSIGSTDVVIRSDDGERLFQRCMVEEILQGLGPLADRGNKNFSIFNTASQHSSFTVHDQVLMNILYDPRIKPGMSKSQVAKILPTVMHDCLKRLNLIEPQS